MDKAHKLVDIVQLFTILRNTEAFLKIPVIPQPIQRLESLNIALNGEDLPCQKCFRFGSLEIIILRMLQSLAHPGFPRPYRLE